ncbi:MAG: A24 family peptidase [Candidatus Woesearchaeota archaeon]
MFLEVTLIAVTLFALIIASYCDLKWREVPDWISYGLIFAALGIRAIFSLSSGWEILISGALGFGIFFGLSCLLYYSNQWGGGDSKLLMGMGGVIGIAYPFDSSSWNLFWFFLLLLSLGAIYGLIWVVGLAIKERKKFLPDFKKKWNEHKTLHLILGIISLLLFVLFLFGLKYNFSFIWPLIPFPLITFYLFLFVTTVENSCFIMKREVTKLTEGDWLAEEVKVADKVVMKKKTLEKEDLEELLRWHKEKKLEMVKVREGVPFVPSFLFAYLALLLWNYFWASNLPF